MDNWSKIPQKINLQDELSENEFSACQINLLLKRCLTECLAELIGPGNENHNKIMSLYDKSNQKLWQMQCIEFQ